MKTKVHKKLAWLLAACMWLMVFPVTALASGSAPSVVEGMENQTGTAAPASDDGLIPAVAYTADMSEWFTDEEDDELTYSVVSAVSESSDDVSEDVTVEGSVVTYTPAAAQASQTVTIVVKANDGTSDSDSVTITVEVSQVPAEVNTPPTVVEGEETQTGTATPASNDGLIPAVAYTADMSEWFTDEEDDELTYSVVSAVSVSSDVYQSPVDVSGDVTIEGSVITYTPAAAQASQTVDIVVKANDGTSDSDSSVTISVTVGEAPASHYELAIGEQSEGGAGYIRSVSIADNYSQGLDGKYLVVQYTTGSADNARVSVVMIELNNASETVTVSYQTSGTAVAVWLTDGMPKLTSEDMEVTVYANASTN